MIPNSHYQVTQASHRRRRKRKKNINIRNKSERRETRTNRVKAAQVLLVCTDISNFIPLPERMWRNCLGRVESFFEILTWTYGPRPYGPGPLGPYGLGPLIILKNILSWICSRTIFEKHTAPGAYSKHAPEAVCISNGPGAYLTYKILSDYEWSRTIRHDVVTQTSDKIVINHNLSCKSLDYIVIVFLTRFTTKDHF